MALSKLRASSDIKIFPIKKLPPSLEGVFFIKNIKAREKVSRAEIFVMVRLMRLELIRLVSTAPSKQRVCLFHHNRVFN